MKIKRKHIIVGTIMILIFFTIIKITNSNKIVATPEEEPAVMQVGTIKLGEYAGITQTIESVGTAKADSKVNVVALGKGTVNSINFKVGEKVFKNKILVNLDDTFTNANYLNALTTVNNLENNLSITKELTAKTIEQAELGIETAQKALEAAQVGFDTAQANKKNSLALQDKRNIDLKETTVISFNNYLNTAKTSLDDINFIIRAEGTAQLDGISITLGAKNLSSVNMAKESYFNAKNSFDALLQKEINSDNIESMLYELIDVIALTKKAVDNTILVLDSTISSVKFPESALNAEKSKFSGLRLSIINTQTQTLGSLHNLQNLSLTNKQEKDGLENALRAANSQLSISRTSLENAKSALENSKTGKDQQILGQQISLDSAEGQLNLAATQASYLTIKAPISGQITKKFVEIGTEVNPGQAVAEISQLNALNIGINVPTEDAQDIFIGQSAILNDKYMSVVTSIEPAADPITKKVAVEITFDNSKSEIIAETFVNVKIETDTIVKSNAGNFFIPLSAVTITQTESSVFLVQNNKAKKQIVELGETKKNLVEITNGLNEGDVVATSGNKNLEDGNSLEIKQ